MNIQIICKRFISEIFKNKSHLFEKLKNDFFFPFFTIHF